MEVMRYKITSPARITLALGLSYVRANGPYAYGELSYPFLAIVISTSVIWPASAKLVVAAFTGMFSLRERALSYNNDIYFGVQICEVF